MGRKVEGGGGGEWRGGGGGRERHEQTMVVSREGGCGMIVAFLWVCGLGLLVWQCCGCVVSVAGMAFLWVCGLGMLVWRCCGWVG